ncbi:MAG TPA: hypothetical protein VK181_07815 [Rhizobium sp.]|nr:hypothetical protein [Rhizobium sp.]
MHHEPARAAFRVGCWIGRSRLRARSTRMEECIAEVLDRIYHNA